MSVRQSLEVGFPWGLVRPCTRKLLSERALCEVSAGGIPHWLALGMGNLGPVEQDLHPLQGWSTLARHALRIRKNVGHVLLLLLP